MTGLNPFDWYGEAFLALYAFLFVGALIAGAAIAAWLRPEGHALPVTDEDELAVLAGGADRLTETVLARMMARGAAIIQMRKVSFASVSGGTPLERELASLPSPAKWSEIRQRVAIAAGRIEQQLAGKGLRMERGEAWQLGLYAAIPLVLLIGFGMIKVQVGLARDRPVGFLVAFMVVTAIAALIRVFATKRATSRGKAVLAEARQRSARIRLAPTQDETGTAVALFGTAVLVGSPIAELHRMRQSSGDGGSGTSGDSGGGGSGCGGGGCGGCGGG
jgi:uncharacterized protein (TIGR04222 family)